MAEQPPTLPPLTVIADFVELEELLDFISSHAGGRELMLEAKEDEEDIGPHV
jgi:hypothetical protein